MKLYLIPLSASIKIILTMMSVVGKHCRLISIAVLALFFCLPNLVGQNTTIIFDTRENSIIGISREIDNTKTGLMDEIQTDAAGNYIHSWDVNDFEFISCTFSDGGIAHFPIIEGTHLTITYKGGSQLEFRGKSKAGAENYLHDLKKNIIHPYLTGLGNFKSAESKNVEDIALLIEKYENALSTEMDSLVAEEMVSAKFSEIVNNSFRIIVTCTAPSLIRTEYIENVTTQIGKQDSIKAERLIDEILDKLSPMIDSGDILKYSSGRSALAVFYTNQYRHLDEREKHDLLEDNEWAHYLKPHYLGYLIAPEDFRYKLLSMELFDKFKSGDSEGISELFDHITEIRPQNAFLPYLKREQEKLLAAMNADHSGVKFIEDSIKSLNDLGKVAVLDQKTLYIDLWGTWCAPCIGEFKHNEKVHELLSSYKDVVPVYISVDSDDQDANWRQKAKTFNLNGYNLRASKELIADLVERIYDGKSGGVPRYILLNKDGNILEKRLPWPRYIESLKAELDKHLD